MPPLTAEQSYAWCADHLRRLAAVGLTGTHVMDGTLASLDRLRELERRGDLVTRILVPFRSSLTPPRRCGRPTRRRAMPTGGVAGGVAKFFIDGVIDSGTGWLYDPDAEGGGRLRSGPTSTATAERSSSLPRAASNASPTRPATAACGRRLTRTRAGAAPGIIHRIEHIETLQPADLPRFAAEGVIASMQAQHMMWLHPDRSDNWSARLGADRCDRAFPIRSLRASGATVTLGSDWPVARFDPREGMAAARLRRPPGHHDRAPYDDQAIDGLAALEGYTVNAARTGGDGDRRGRLAPGFAADVTVMEHDPVQTDPDALVSVPVLLTVVDGEIVFRGGSLA